MKSQTLNRLSALLTGLALLPVVAGLPLISSSSAQSRILECTAADGTVSYVDAKSCPSNTTGAERVVPEHRVTLTEAERARAYAIAHPPKAPTPEQLKERQLIAEALARHLKGPDAAPPARRAAPPRNTVSFRCSAAGGVWYRHSPCPRTIGGGRVERWNNNGDLVSKIQDGVPVTQEMVTRSFACKEIRRSGSAAREGRQLDEVTSPYARLKGDDPC